jgi:divalent anion:Na+ symporter, DASS family
MGPLNPTSKQMWIRLAICAGVGALLWLMAKPDGWVTVQGIYVPPDEPAPEGATDLTVGWHVFSVFAAAIAAFLLRPLPMGAVTIVALATLCISGTLKMSQAMAGYADETVWLVVAAFLIAGSVIRTGFGRRIALGLVVWLGRSLIGLGYALCGAEMILGTLIPSNTARGGGVLAPITRSLAEALKSFPDNGPERGGAFLMLVGAHANLVASAMYLTGMAANPLVRRAANDVFGIDFGWGTWALGAIVPALLSFLVLPPLIARLTNASLVDVSAARLQAREQLTVLGRWRRDEKIMAGLGILLVTLWITSSWHGMGATLVAWIGVCALLLLRTESWDGVLKNQGAWDALIWVGGILTMANQLRDHGIIGWFAHTIQTAIIPFPVPVVLLMLALAYFYSMYAFSMLTAHIAAMVAAFLVIAHAAGAPALVSVAVMAYFSNLCACLTPYSSGPVIIYFGNGYVSSPRWFGVGFVVSLVHLTLWLGAGALWWKGLGWW